MNADLNPLIGIPYLDRGRTPAGADCWGLAVLAHALVGVELPAYADYQDVTRRERHELAAIINAHRSEWTEIPAGQEQPLDLVLLRVMGCPSHVGVVAGRGRMLTTERGGFAYIARYHSPRWQGRVEGFYRHA